MQGVFHRISCAVRDRSSSCRYFSWFVTAITQDGALLSWGDSLDWDLARNERSAEIVGDLTNQKLMSLSHLSWNGLGLAFSARGWFRAEMSREQQKHCIYPGSSQLRNRKVYIGIPWQINNNEVSILLHLSSISQNVQFYSTCPWRYRSSRYLSTERAPTPQTQSCSICEKPV